MNPIIKITGLENAKKDIRSKRKTNLQIIETLTPEERKLFLNRATKMFVDMYREDKKNEDKNK